MEILGIGPSELLFIVILALIILGPRDMQKAGRTLGKWMRRIVTSDGWRLFQQTSREIQTLPNRLMREAALDELKEMQKDIQQPLQGLQQDLRQPFEINPRPAQPSTPATGQTAPPVELLPPGTPDNRILPPASTPPPPSSPADDKDKNV